MKNRALAQILAVCDQVLSGEQLEAIRAITLSTLEAFAGQMKELVYDSYRSESPQSPEITAGQSSELGPSA